MQRFKSVLLVDDDPAANFLHTFYFQEWGYADNIYTALNGQEALDFLNTNEDFNNNKPSLILLDVNMPVMNGFEFMESYKDLDESKKATVVVVMLTSSLHPNDQEKADSLPDLKSYLNKPLEKEQLDKMLAQLQMQNI